MGNAFLFPKIPSTYKVGDIENLFWVPECLAEVPRLPKSTSELQQFMSNIRDRRYIPVQYLPSEGARTVLLYFHGNSCDLGDMVDEMKCIRDHSGRHVVHFEYPGYGVCTADGLTATAPMIDKWARAVANYLISAGVPPSHIVPFGRSIGTGPAAALALWLQQTYGKVGGLCLQSPYISIHVLVADYAWQPAKFLFTNDWDTKANLAKLAPSATPFLVVHGEIDEVIPVRHGRELYETYDVPERLKEGVYPPQSQHNAYFVLEDLVQPIDSWLRHKTTEGQRNSVELEIVAAAKVTPPTATAGRRGASSHFLGPQDSGPLHKEDLRPGMVVQRQNRGLLSYLLCGCESPPPPSPQEIATTFDRRAIAAAFEAASEASSSFERKNE